MINLLATNRKAELSAARTNIIILRYMGIVILAFAFIFGVFYTTYQVLQDTMKSSNELIMANDGKAAAYSETQQQVNALDAQLTETRGILNSEIRFSQVLVRIGQAMPAGTVIANITLTNEAFFGTPIEMKAYAKSSAEATQLQSQLQTSPLFSQVTLQSTETSGGTATHPAVVTLSVTLNGAGI